MTGPDVALTESARPSSKTKRSRAKRSRRGKRQTAHAPAPARGPIFNELEQAFFAAAPPEEPPPTAEPERFDDLVALALPPSRQQPFGRALAAAGAALRRFFYGPAGDSRSTSRR
jgi:hypothetical protein